MVLLDFVMLFFGPSPMISCPASPTAPLLSLGRQVTALGLELSGTTSVASPPASHHHLQSSAHQPVTLRGCLCSSISSRL
jgi:hypothetical protein